MYFLKYFTIKVLFMMYDIYQKINEYYWSKVMNIIV